MAEDLRSKMAAIYAAKAERAKKQEDETKKSAEMSEAQEAAGKENVLRDKAKELEAKVVVAEQSAQEAVGTIEQAQGMLAEGGLEPEEQAIIEEGIKEEEKKIEELNTTKAELASIVAEIEQLNTKEAVATAETPMETTSEAPTEAVVETTPVLETKKSEIQEVKEQTAKELIDDIGALIKQATEHMKYVKNTPIQNIEGADIKLSEVKNIRSEALKKINQLVEGLIKGNKPDEARKWHNNFQLSRLIEKIDGVIDSYAAKINGKEDDREMQKQSEFTAEEAEQIVKFFVDIENQLDKARNKQLEPSELNTMKLRSLDDQLLGDGRSGSFGMYGRLSTEAINIIKQQRELIFKNYGKDARKNLAKLTSAQIESDPVFFQVGGIPPEDKKLIASLNRGIRQTEEYAQRRASTTA